jgi:HNH endonuclease
MGCTICGKSPVIGRGLCKPHYEHAQRRGLLDNYKTKVEAGVSRRPIEERFYEKIEKMPSGCWHWTGALHKFGYGMMSDWPKVKRAHRVSYEIHCGPIPDGLLVRHKCDNKICVNPDHLELGTKRDNARDAVERGQFKPKRKLTDKQIREIRNSVGSTCEVARFYGVMPSTVSRIRTGARWANLK